MVRMMNDLLMHNKANLCVCLLILAFLRMLKLSVNSLQRAHWIPMSHPIDMERSVDSLTMKINCLQTLVQAFYVLELESYTSNSHLDAEPRVWAIPFTDPLERLEQLLDIMINTDVNACRPLMVRRAWDINTVAHSNILLLNTPALQTMRNAGMPSKTPLWNDFNAPYRRSIDYN